jgi:hypothetical protein
VPGKPAVVCDGPRRLPADHGQVPVRPTPATRPGFCFPSGLSGTNPTTGPIDPPRRPLETRKWAAWLSTTLPAHPERAASRSQPDNRQRQTRRRLNQQTRDGLKVNLFTGKQTTETWRVNARDGYGHGNGAGVVPCDDGGLRASIQPERPRPGRSERRVRR